MTEHGIIRRDFHRKDKVVNASNAAIGLWARAISWCKDHRRAGRLTVDEALALGTQAEIDELFRVRLWLLEGDMAVFKDWDDVYPGDIRAGDASSAEHIVYKILPGFPVEVRHSLAMQVKSLIGQGMSLAVIEDGLRRWSAVVGANPVWLPQFVGDAMKAESGSRSKLKALRDAWVDGKTSRLSEFGLIFTPNPAPEGLSDMALRAHRLSEKREWIEGLVKELERGAT